MTDLDTEYPKRDEIQAIIADLDAGRDRLPVQAIQAARQHKERVIPELIQGMQRAVRAWRPKTTQKGNLAFFALFLLTEFRASEGLPAILEAMSLPDNGPFDLFGDAIHDVLPRVLILLGKDQSAEIACALVRNTALNEYVRWSAAKVLVYLAIAGLRTRAEMLSQSRQLLREAVEKQDTEAVGALVITMMDLNPWEAADELEDAPAAAARNSRDAVAGETTVDGKAELHGRISYFPGSAERHTPLASWRFTRIRFATRQ